MKKYEYKYKNTNTNGDNYQVQENGSLFFSSVEKQDEAEYRCKVAQIIIMKTIMTMMTIMTTVMMISNDDHEGEEHVRGGSVPCFQAQG